MKSFDEWFGEASQDKLFWESPSKASKMGFEAGQQSKQFEVDELRERIDEINKLVDLWREDYVTLVKYDDGNRYCLEDCINRVVNILKGDQS